MTVAERAESVSHFIGGREVPSHSGRTFEAIDPSSGEVITQVAFGDPEDIDRAVQIVWLADNRRNISRSSRGSQI